MQERNRRASSLALSMLMISVAFLGVLMFAQPVAAVVNLYWVPTNTGLGACDYMVGGVDMGNSACWSATSNGVGGAGMPSASTDVHFDRGSVGGNSAPVGNTFGPGETVTVHDIFIDPSYSAVSSELDFIGAGDGVSPAATLVFHDLTDNLNGVVSVSTGYINGFNVHYSGIIHGFSIPNNDQCTNGTINGLCISKEWGGQSVFLKYIGPVQTSAENVDFDMIDASSGSTVYCSPGCTDDGGNINIIFGPAPPPAAGGPPASTPNAPTLSQVIAVDALLIAVAVAVVLLLALIVAALRPLLPWLAVILLFAVVIWLIFSGAV